MKKFFSLVMCVLLVFCLAACGNTKDVDVNNNQKKDAENVSEENFEWDNNIIIGLSDKGCNLSTLVIPARCEGFGGAIFSEKENQVTTVSFETNKDISLNGAFTGASKIKRIDLPAGITTIGNMEFWLCESLEEILIPDSVTTIGEAAFQDCSNLKSVSLGNGVTEIQEYAFDGCSSLKTVTFSDSVVKIGQYAFYECVNLDKVILPKALKNVGAFAFANGGLVELTVPQEVELESYDTTSFVQTLTTVRVLVKEGSWMDNNFDSVFENGYIKETK